MIETILACIGIVIAFVIIVACMLLPYYILLGAIAEIEEEDKTRAERHIVVGQQRRNK